MTLDETDVLLNTISGAMNRDDADEIQRLLSMHPDLLHRDVGNQTWLHMAAKKGC